jgi:hypothetical protein
MGGKRTLAWYDQGMSTRRRELLSTAFERAAGQWVWYANATSRGIVVTPAEREMYLAFKPLAFRQAIRDREATMPRRPYWRTLKRLLVAAIMGRDPKGQNT